MGTLHFFAVVFLLLRLKVYKSLRLIRFPLQLQNILSVFWKDLLHGAMCNFVSEPQSTVALKGQTKSKFHNTNTNVTKQIQKAATRIRNVHVMTSVIVL